MGSHFRGNRQISTGRLLSEKQRPPRPYRGPRSVDGRRGHLQVYRRATIEGPARTISARSIQIAGQRGDTDKSYSQRSVGGFGPWNSTDYVIDDWLSAS